MRLISGSRIFMVSFFARVLASLFSRIGLNMTSNCVHALLITLIIDLFNVDVTVQSPQLVSIFLRLYTGKTMDEFVDEPIANAKMLVFEMKSTKPTVLYVHGYTESVRSRSVRTVIDAYLKRGDHNVLVVDWSEIAKENYIRVVQRVGEVGSALATALNEMANAGLKVESLHVVGHSMGGEVVGYIGRNVSFDIPRITGLDPAGPLFNFLEPRLSASDALFVDVIHTDYGFYGIARTIGDADFFPNGGHRVQPGCPLRFAIGNAEEFCSHHRSWIYYAESLRKEDSFLSVRCSSIRRFLFGECSENEKALMGYGAMATTNNATGKYYLMTNSEYPFGLEEQGTRPA